MQRYDACNAANVDWLGDIPASWSCANLGVIARQRKNLNKDGDVESVLSLSYGKIKRRVMDNSGLLPESFNTYNVIESGDVVLRLTDLQNDQRSLRVGLCHERGIITAAYVTLEATAVNSRYLYYSLAAFDFWKGFYGLAGGVRQSLTYDGIRNLRFPLPSKSEQIAIADYLDAKTAEIDMLVADCEREVELLQEYRKAVISEAVTKGLDPTVPMKESGIEWIGEIPEKWIVVKLGLIASSTLGRMLDSEKQSGNCLAPYLSNKDVQWFRIDSSNLKEMDFPYEARQEYEIHDGDLLVCEGGEVGRCAVWHGETPAFFFQKAIHRVRFNLEVVDPDYAAYQMFQKSQVTLFREVRKGESTIAHLPGEQLVRLMFLVPPLAEQRAIAGHLDTKTAEIDSLIADRHALTDKLREYRKSLISETVTGKIKIPGV